MQKEECLSSDYSQLLTICLPTFNRGLVICEALADLIPKIKEFGITIIVVDNCSTDFTRNIVEGFTSAYPQLHYFCQTSNKGYDINFETALKLSKTPYTWVIGDGNRLEAHNIESMLISLDKKRPDAYVVDSFSRASFVTPQTFTTADKLLSDLGWHMTLLSSVIFSQKIIENANFEKYRKSHFIHFGIFFEYLGLASNFSVLWEDLNLINASKLPKLNSWNPYRVLEIFGKAWMDVVFKLPETISYDSKLKCIQFHNKQQALFHPKHLKRQKAVGGLSYSLYKLYRPYMSVFAPGKRWLILLYCFYPNCLNKYYRRYKRHGYLVF